MKYLNGFFKRSMALPCLIVLLLTTNFAVAGENSKTSLKEKVGNHDRQFFVKNKGQVTYTNGTPAEGVKYTLSSGNVKVYFQEDRVSYVYPKPVFKATPDRPHRDSMIENLELYRMDMRIKGSNPDGQLRAKGALEAFSNYLKPGNEVTQVPHYEKVVYENIYPGIDLHFGFKDGRLKYEFEVSENGDPSDIQLVYDGAEEIAKRQNGDLMVQNPFGTLEEEKPYAYKPENPGSEVKCNFEVDGKALTFDFKEEVETPVVIDPYLSVSTYLGGSDWDLPNDVQVNSNDNDRIYVVGRTYSADFPTTAGVGQSSLNGPQDGFLAKYSADGQTKLWATYYGAGNSESITDVDFYGDYPYVVGHSNSANLPGTSSGSYQSQNANAGSDDLFIARFDYSNGSVMATTFLGGDDDDYRGNIIVHSGNNFVISGNTNSSNFPTKNASQPSLGGNYDAVIARMEFTSLYFSSYYGGSSYDYSFDLEDLPNGEHVVQGQTKSTNLPQTSNGYQSSLNNATDLFLMQFDISGNFQNATYLGGKDADWNSYNSKSTLDVGPDDYIHVIGRTKSSDYPVTADAYQSSHQGGWDICYTRFSDLSTVDYSTYYGGSNDDKGGAVTAYGQNHYILGGNTASSDIPIKGTEPPLQYNMNGPADALLAEFQQDNLHWGTYYGGSQDESIRGIAQSLTQNQFFACGNTSSPDYPVTSTAPQSTYGGPPWDAFLTGFDFDETCIRPNATQLRNPEFTTSTTLEGNYEITGDMVITSGTLTIKNANLLFDHCAELRVKNGANLTIQDASLNTCNPYWKGIRVESSGSDVDFDNAYIKNAEVGIDAKEANTFSVTNSKFLENIYSISLRTYDNPNTWAKIHNNYFENIHTPEEVTFCSADPLPQQYYRPEVRKVINIEPLVEDTSIKYVDMEGNEIRNTSQNYTLLQMHEARNIVGQFTLLNNWKVNDNRQGIYIEEGRGNITIENTLMEIENETMNGIEAYLTDELTIQDLELHGKGSSFDQTGVYLETVDYLNITNSDVRHFRNGISYFKSGGYNNPTPLIDHNTIFNNAFGLVVAPEEHPINNNTSANSPTNTINLDITCNKFFDNEVGILGSGNLKNQGSSSAEAGNNFDDQTGNSQNTDWDILWQNPAPNQSSSTTIQYFHFPTPTGYLPNCNSCGLNRSSYTMNGTTQNSPSGLNFQSSGNSTRVCYGLWKRSPVSSVTEPDPEKEKFLKVFPNPFEEKLQIQVKKAGNGTIEVLNLKGKTITKQSLESKNETLRTNQWAPGQYIIKVITKEGAMHTRKLIKTQ